MDKCTKIWLGIGFLVKTFNRGEDKEIDTNEIIKLLEKDDDNERQEPSL